MSPELKQLYMPIEDAVNLCGIDEKYANAHVCAGGWQRGEDVCSGDSGGPLTCREANGKWYLRGVTSLGDMLCRSYGIFAKVSLFKEWIENTVNSKASVLDEIKTNRRSEKGDKSVSMSTLT